MTTVLEQIWWLLILIVTAKIEILAAQGYINGGGSSNLEVVLWMVSEENHTNDVGSFSDAEKLVVMAAEWLEMMTEVDHCGNYGDVSGAGTTVVEA